MTFVLVHGAWHGPWCWERLVPDLLGVEPVELDGGHSPFLSRPGALADLLVRLA